MFLNEHDTIFAPASAAGRAAIAVVRISGPDCAKALAAIAPGKELLDRRATLRTLRHPHSNEPLDRALITRFYAPRSFTGEELAEIGVTGGRAVVAALVKALALIPGLRLAEPGEFAWRAFMNGKIDLSAVEGLADLVEAETEAQRRQALRIAGGALGRECEAIRESLLDAMAAVETQIDFSDVEDSADFTLRTVKDAARAAIARIDRALATADQAQRLRDGFTVVIAGPPNAGKSTLMNALAGRDVAITSPIPGTTRDLIEVFLDLRGYPVILVDTAGIRESRDPIELEGVARARRRAEGADLTLWLNDGSGGQAPSLSSPILTVRTKIDLDPAGAPLWGRGGVGGRAGQGASNAPAEFGTSRNVRQRDPPPGLPRKSLRPGARKRGPGGGGEPSTDASFSSEDALQGGATPLGADLAISARTGAHVDRLLDVIAELAEERMSSSEPALLTLERHRRAFLEAREALAPILEPGASAPELVAEDLRRATNAMDRVVGRIGVEEVLGAIFARLCVGK